MTEILIAACVIAVAVFIGVSRRTNLSRLDKATIVVFVAYDLFLMIGVLMRSAR